MAATLPHLIVQVQRRVWHHLRVRHHKHSSLVSRFDRARATLVAHPDAQRSDARLVWIPVVDAGDPGSDVPLEALLSVPTRPGAVRVVAVPHIAHHLAFGDELAVIARDDLLLARGELASSLHGTIRVVLAPSDPRSWREVARLIDTAAHGTAGCWFDPVSERAFAAAVPRDALGAVFETLRDHAVSSDLAWEYATPHRHV